MLHLNLFVICVSIYSACGAPGSFANNPFLTNPVVVKKSSQVASESFGANPFLNNQQTTYNFNQNPFVSGNPTRNTVQQFNQNHLSTRTRPTSAPNPFLVNQVPSISVQNPPSPGINHRNPTSNGGNVIQNPFLSGGLPSFNNPAAGGRPGSGNNVEYLKTICGLVDQTISLIANGEEATKSDFPWLGAIFRRRGSSSTFICGATLITNKHALTGSTQANWMKPTKQSTILCLGSHKIAGLPAGRTQSACVSPEVGPTGHCVYDQNPSKFYLILGREDITDWLSEGKQIPIHDTHVHENYIRRQGDSDIAILTLGEEVRFTSLIRPICLWNLQPSTNGLVGTNGVVVGWGVQENGKYPSKPRKAELPIVSETECLRSHDGYRLITSDRTFCAGSRNGTGPCSGDSGSGMYAEENGRWNIRGIVSVGIYDADNDTCDLSHFVVFVDAVKYRDWIRDYIQS